MKPVMICAVLAAGSLASCDFTAFDNYRNHSSIVTVEEPTAYPNLHFGEAFAVAGDAHGNSWLVASGGLGTAVVAIPLFDNGYFAPSNPMPRTICSAADPNSCAMAMNYGVALGGTTRWGSASLCAMTGAFGAVHRVFVSCFGDGAPQTFTLQPPMGLEMAGFGEAIATPQARRTGDPPAGDLAIVGAPAGSGHVLVAQPSGVVDITPTIGMGLGSLGDAVAVGRIVTAGVTDLLVAGGGTMGRAVQVWRGDPRAGRLFQPIGCVVHNDEPGFGGVIALGDFDGDGNDDLAVGDAASATQRTQNVYVYLAAAMPARNSCDGTSWPAAVRLTCSDMNGAQCSNLDAGFGSALTALDLDADGRDELVVGAPGATVDGSTRAGAMWIHHGAGAGPSFALNVAGVLRDANPTTDTQLGSALGLAHLGTRDELLASAAGVLAIRLFLCTGIPGDTPGGMLGTDCRPTP